MWPAMMLRENDIFLKIYMYIRAKYRAKFRLVIRAQLLIDITFLGHYNERNEGTVPVMADGHYGRIGNRVGITGGTAAVCA